MQSEETHSKMLGFEGDSFCVGERGDRVIFSSYRKWKYLDETQTDDYKVNFIFISKNRNLGYRP